MYKAFFTLNTLVDMTSRASRKSNQVTFAEQVMMKIDALNDRYENLNAKITQLLPIPPPPGTRSSTFTTTTSANHLKKMEMMISQLCHTQSMTELSIIGLAAKVDTMLVQTASMYTGIPGYFSYDAATATTFMPTSDWKCDEYNSEIKKSSSKQQVEIVLENLIDG